jgi:acyl dehydratase
MTSPRILSVRTADLPQHVGTILGPSDWVTINQSAIDTFGQVTGDNHWIHTDPERAARDLPGGKTIVHGYHSLALLTGLLGQILKVEFNHALNYGLDRVRFLAPVPVRSRLRLKAELAAATPQDGGGVKAETDCVLELEGSERPALFARWISVFYP